MVHTITFIEANSLNVIPKIIKNELPCPNSERDPARDSWGPWDLIMIDGDHNYRTVYTELVMLTSHGLSHTNTLFVLDDYGTRHARQDQYYGTRDTHENYPFTPPDELVPPEGKSGVRCAIDDFVAENQQWHIIHPDIPGEGMADYALMIHKDHVAFNQMVNEDVIYSMCMHNSAILQQLNTAVYRTNRNEEASGD